MYHAISQLEEEALSDANRRHGRVGVWQLRDARQDCLSGQADWLFLRKLINLPSDLCSDLVWLIINKLFTRLTAAASPPVSLSATLPPHLQSDFRGYISHRPPISPHKNRAATQPPPPTKPTQNPGSLPAQWQHRPRGTPLRCKGVPLRDEVSIREFQQR